jgi:dCTP deaminase
MGVLSDKEIKELLLSKEIIIHPILAEDQIQGAKIDLRLSNVVYLIKHFAQPVYDPKGPEVEYGETRKISFDTPFILHPGDFVIAPLFERVKLPDNILGRIDGRSSLGRLGVIVHVTAGGIDPGYSGILTCELSNLGRVPVALYFLTRIASLMLEKLSRVEKSYVSRSDRKYKFGLSTLLSKDFEYKNKILDKMTRYL